MLSRNRKKDRLIYTKKQGAPKAMKRPEGHPVAFKKFYY